MMDMDMDMATGLPWLDKPVMLHSSRADNCTLNAEQCAWRRGHWRYWYNADRVYAQNTVYFCIATIALFTLAHLISKFAPVSLRRNGLYQRTTAVGRFLAYRGFRVRIPGMGSGYWAVTASLGVLGLVLAGVVFFFGMTLGPKPYYWPNTDDVSYGGSPPLATRAGWMAVALLPFILILGTKSNPITTLTGIPHEKLQLFHHWLSYAMFVLALVHTFPFIVNDIAQGKMMEEWRTSVFYWTGVAALIPQAWLTGMSVPWIRNRWYEFFKGSHLVIALLFVLFFFLHCDFRLSSWDYFIAAGSLYTLSLATSLIRTHLINAPHSAHLTLLPCSLLEIRIPTILSWTPGQHVFLRFTSSSNGLALHSLTSHPFTICSTAFDMTQTGKPNEMLFFVKPKSGVTGRLAALARKSPDTRIAVQIEGPYGGVDTAALQRAEKVIVVSGGSGGGFGLGVLGGLLNSQRSRGSGGGEKGNFVGNKDVKVVFASHTEDYAVWYQGEIDSVLSGCGCDTTSSSSPDIDVAIHVTSPPSLKENDKDIENTPPSNPNPNPEPEPEPKTQTQTQTHTSTMEPLSSSSSASASHPHPTGTPKTFETGRPDLPALISQITSENNKNVAIYVCGPTSMLHDVRNAAADAQEGILGGKKGGEVFLHSESFSW